MNDKFILVGLNDERSKQIAEVLKNKTCKKIIGHLGDVKEASEKDISDACDIPMNTVGYNIKNLIKAGLVEKTKNFFWSVKGKKIKMYKLARKHIVISPSKKPNLTMLKGILPVILVALVALLVVINFGALYPDDSDEPGFSRFESGEDLVNAFENLGERFEKGSGGVMIMEANADSAGSLTASDDYSETNIQVQGVDEADIIKTDGEYIYAIADGKLIIIKAYPSERAEILSEIELNEFRGSEIFIEDNRLIVFGSFYEEIDKVPFVENEVVEEDYYPRSTQLTSVRLYDVSDKENPELLKEVDFEGNYVTSRKINSDVYFVVNSYPNYYDKSPACEEIIPMYREDNGNPEPMVACTEVGYIEPIQAQGFITIASISISDENKEVEKEVIVGSGQNVYASLENLYIAQTNWPSYSRVGILAGDVDQTQKTVITKFSLDNGEIEFAGSGEVKGHILNQFSMDEYEGNFRIATTIGEVWNSEEKSTNNVYVLNEELNVVGELEELAPGEKIYSVRFMGGRGYVVTFKKVDPLFVIDLSNAENPNVLGKLKIPGYSDYLHPYDENHLIGIGKDTVEAESETRDFAWYQGIKMAIFDVSDVENPIEMHKVIIGDRGTDSEALRNHKAFLFDREKELLVLPITLAEIKGEPAQDNQHGEYTFQGAYVYDINLEDGFELRDRITHHEDDEVFKKSGYYLGGELGIKRSLYIGDVLYTLSDTKLQLNELDSLEKIKEFIF
ncbi:helix-turn-helix domain-containing protein [archaeon]|nr:helix-turn-helix domain-containing protein [archaeon]MBT4242059.1 helix-turn-helix domain-containing protein [archaeon]MBT4417747.1 helix-turn-helix domain-containing protein [archaeon]